MLKIIPIFLTLYFVLGCQIKDPSTSTSGDTSQNQVFHDSCNSLDENTCKKTTGCSWFEDKCDEDKKIIKIQNERAQKLSAIKTKYLAQQSLLTSKNKDGLKEALDFFEQQNTEIINNPAVFSGNFLTDLRRELDSKDIKAIKDELQVAYDNANKVREIKTEQDVLEHLDTYTAGSNELKNAMKKLIFNDKNEIDTNRLDLVSKWAKTTNETNSAQLGQIINAEFDKLSKINSENDPYATTFMNQLPKNEVMSDLLIKHTDLIDTVADNRYNLESIFPNVQSILSQASEDVLISAKGKLSYLLKALLTTDQIKIDLTELVQLIIKKANLDLKDIISNKISIDKLVKIFKDDDENLKKLAQVIVSGNNRTISFEDWFVKNLSSNTTENIKKMYDLLLDENDKRKFRSLYLGASLYNWDAAVDTKYIRQVYEVVNDKNAQYDYINYKKENKEGTFHEAVLNRKKHGLENRLMTEDTLYVPRPEPVLDLSSFN